MEDQIENVSRDSKRHGRAMEINKVSSIPTFSENNDFLQKLKSRISPANFQLIAAINHVVSVSIKNKVVYLGTEGKIYSEYFKNQIEFINTETRHILGNEHQVIINGQETVCKPISQINKEQIIRIFHGHEIV